MKNKTILSTLFFLLALCATSFAANPSYTDFDPIYFLKSGNMITMQPGVAGGATNGITAAQATNISAFQAKQATNVLSGPAVQGWVGLVSNKNSYISPSDVWFGGPGTRIMLTNPIITGASGTIGAAAGLQPDIYSTNINGAFYGDLSNGTNLNASSLASGTVPLGRMGNVITNSEQNLLVTYARPGYRSMIDPTYVGGDTNSFWQWSANQSLPDFTLDYYTAGVFATRFMFTPEGPLVANNFSDTASFPGTNSFTHPVNLPSLTASALIKLNSSKNLASVANAAGALTNDGVGNIGWLAGIGGSSGSGLPGTNQIIARGSTQNTNWVSETPAGLVETNSNGGSVTLSNGTIVANGPAGVNGNITLNDSAGGLELTSTNGGLWIKNGITDTGHTNTSLTASRVILTDANKGQASAAASGAVPINADGSATTGAQGQALGYVLTNDSRALTLSGTNYWHGNQVWDGAQEIFSNSLAITGNLNTTNGVNQITNTSAANQGITLDPTKNYSLFSAGAFGVGTTGWTNTAAAQFNYANLQFSTNCGWGGVQSNGTANSTLTLKGFEEFVISMGNTIVQLGDATTNLGHHIAITCGSAGTNAITTVSSQKIAGLTKWTNTAIFTCTQLISDGANWQICGTRGN